MRLKLISLILFLSLCGGVLKAQNTEYGAMVDTAYMMIGDQQHLTFQVKGDAGIRVAFPVLRDTVSRGIEIISGPVRDSVKESDGRWLFRETYVITAFDTGVYVIPSLPIGIENQDYNNVLRTDPLSFVVNTYEVDPQKGNYDIVMPYAAPWTLAEILPYILWTLLGLAVIAGVWWFIVQRRKNRPLFAPKKEEIPPYVKAIKSLDEIKAEKLWQTGKEKEYYTKLTDTLRQYLDDEFQIPAMEQTSAETVKAMADCPLVNVADRERATDMLATADFVKFAKYTPLQDESARYLDTAYDFVNNTHERLLQELSEQRKLEEAEKERRRREEAEAQKVAGGETAGDTGEKENREEKSGKPDENPGAQQA